MNTTARSLLIATLLFCWALLLGARTIGAAIYSSHPGRTYEAGLNQIGDGLPIAAWCCFAAAGILLITASTRKETGDRVTG